LDAKPARVRHDFDLMTVQRKLKDTGRFVFIDRVKGNPSFLPYRGPSMAYVRSALDGLTDFAALRDLIGELDPP
jgi:aminoglycoside/choline kinase family phosphotransferase